MEDFSRAVARVVAAQIAESAGFDACQDSAVEILADLLLRYLGTLAASSHSYAELAGRSQANLADLLLALEEVGVAAEDLHSHMQQQGTDVPFAHTLAPFPVHSQRPLPPTFADQKEPHAAHIPPFLPAFPDAHTHQHSAAFAGHEPDPHKQRQSMLEAKRKAEAALSKLHQRMSSSKAASQHDANPFLEPPVLEQLPDALPPRLPQLAAQLAPLAATTAAAGAGGTRQQPAAAAAAAAGLQAAAPQQQQQQQQHEADDEDALFETAAVLKAFSSILPADLLAKAAGSAGGSGASQQQAATDGIQEDGLQPMELDGSAAAAADGGSGGWLEWKPPAQPVPQQHVPPQRGGGGAAAAAAAQGASGGPEPGALARQAAAAELLAFGIDPLAAGRRGALALAGRRRPADAYAEHGRALPAAPGQGGGRQRKSRYDADPRLVQARGILDAGPEAVFAAAGGGGGGVGGSGGALQEMFDTGDALDDDAY